MFVLSWDNNINLRFLIEKINFTFFHLSEPVVVFIPPIERALKHFSLDALSARIALFTVYDAILAGGQTRLKLQWMYGILAHLEPL